MALVTSADPCGAADPAAAPVRVVLEFDPVPQAAGAARRAAGSVLAEWGAASLAESVELVVSELVTNALLHAEGHGPEAGAKVRLELELDGRTVICRVADSSPAPPRPEDACETAESGRGLILVDALAADWGWEDLDDGKSVWASFEL